MRRATLACALVLAIAGPLACGGDEEAIRPHDATSPAHEASGGLVASPSGALEIHDARIEPSPAGRGPAGGFLTLVNGSDRVWTLVGASSPAAGRVELHRSWIDAGIARMEAVAELSIAPGERVTLEPGGHHLMLFDARDLAPGGEVLLRLEFADAPPREVSARVAAAGGRPDEHHAHDHP